MRNTGRILLAFHSGSRDLLESFVEAVRKLDPALPLYVISETQPSQGRWIRWYPRRSFLQNFARTRDAVRGCTIRLAAIILEPGQPYWGMRAIGALMAAGRLLCFNESLNHFGVHPRSAKAIVRHVLWRARNLVYQQTHKDGALYIFLWRLYHPQAFWRPLVYRAALLSGWMASIRKAWMEPAPAGIDMKARPNGVSVVIPSRDGRDLLERLMPGLSRELRGYRFEIIVVDNGSHDGTAEWLRAEGVTVLEGESPVGFAEAVNLGIERARYRYVCLLSNDMLLEEGFFEPLIRAFGQIPDLFCATAQISFPFGRRREETGKTHLVRKGAAQEFPLRCSEPYEGEDLSYVLYGSGGCSLYEGEKLAALGGMATVFSPASVEDLDLGYRAWQRGWATVFVAGAKVHHLHRSTTSRYYDSNALQSMVEMNYLRFLARSVADRRVFRELWKHSTWRLNLYAGRPPAPTWAMQGLRRATIAAVWAEAPPRPCANESEVLALTSGEVAVFPGCSPRSSRRMVVASPFVPFPLSHGGAVRMYNMMRRSVTEFDQVLVAFVDELQPPPTELLEICVEIALVRRVGTHLRPLTARPDVVEEFDSEAYRGALKAMMKKWNVELVQFELTQMGQYAKDCAGCKTILVEHDVTLDLYQQMRREEPAWETLQQLKRWERHERALWGQVDAVVAMSEKDRRMIQARRTVVIPNGVDSERFRPTKEEPEARRILFIGAFRHMPNLSALEFFLREVWPRIQMEKAVLHVIGGAEHALYLRLARERVELDLDREGIEVEGFVNDVRPAYRRAEVVIAPLLASAGTNIKIFEAMAMGKAIVTTPAGINGIDVEHGKEVLVARNGAEMAEVLLGVFSDKVLRDELGQNARRKVEQHYDWGKIAARQSELYSELCGTERVVESVGRI